MVGRGPSKELVRLRPVLGVGLVDFEAGGVVYLDVCCGDIDRACSFGEVNGDVCDFEGLVLALLDGTFLGLLERSITSCGWLDDFTGILAITGPVDRSFAFDGLFFSDDVLVLLVTSLELELELEVVEAVQA